MGRLYKDIYISANMLIVNTTAVVEAGDASAEDVGAARLTGPVLAGAASVLNHLLGEAVDDRDRQRREVDVPLVIDRQGQRVLRGEDLQGLDLSGPDISPVEDQHLDRTSANLNGAYLTAVNLPAAQFRKANSTGAVVAGADLGDVVLRGAERSGATVCDADLRGADLTAHTGEFPECDEVVTNSDTKFRGRNGAATRRSTGYTSPQFSLDDDLEAPGGSSGRGDGPGADIDRLGAIRLLEEELSPGWCTVTVRDSGVPTRSASEEILIGVAAPDVDPPTAGSEDQGG